MLIYLIPYYLINLLNDCRSYYFTFEERLGSRLHRLGLTLKLFSQFLDLTCSKLISSHNEVDGTDGNFQEEAYFEFCCCRGFIFLTLLQVLASNLSHSLAYHLHSELSGGGQPHDFLSEATAGTDFLSFSSYQVFGITLFSGRFLHH